MRILTRTFYKQDTVTVAQQLLGKILVRRINNKEISGTIIETEAYRFKDDPASHAHKGITERNKAMFEEVGRAYVYFTYGMYYCFNVVARSEEFDAGAVLIRGIEPLNGVSEMIKRRKTSILKNLTNGPAKVTQALDITKRHYGIDLTKRGEIYIAEDKHNQDFNIKKSKRIGIKKGTDKLWNFRI